MIKKWLVQCVPKNLSTKFLYKEKLNSYEISIIILNERTQYPITLI